MGRVSTLKTTKDLVYTTVVVSMKLCEGINATTMDLIQVIAGFMPAMVHVYNYSTVLYRLYLHIFTVIYLLITYINIDHLVSDLVTTNSFFVFYFFTIFLIFHWKHDS